MALSGQAAARIDSGEIYEVLHEEAPAMAKLLVTLLAVSAPCALISQTLDLNAADAAMTQGSPRSLKTRFTYRASVPNIPAGTKS